MMGSSFLADLPSLYKVLFNLVQQDVEAYTNRDLIVKSIRKLGKSAKKLDPIITQSPSLALSINTIV